jgi:aryl-alcohol dehydrogenase-like predicted oxidoreductase
VICTKVVPEHHRRDDLLRACEGSLRRLRTDHIDLYLLHWPSHEIGFEEPLRALETLREQGKIRAAGVSNFAVRDLGEILALGRIEANQLPYNLLWRAIEGEVAPLCVEHDVSILCYSPLLHGLLTGAYATADDVPPGQARTAHFSKNRPMAPHETDGAEELTFETIEAIRDLARASGHSMAELALAWLLERPGVASALVGARCAAEATSDARAADVRLDEGTLTALDEATDALARHFGPDPDPWRIPGRMR